MLTTLHLCAFKQRVVYLCPSTWCVVHLCRFTWCVIYLYTLTCCVIHLCRFAWCVVYMCPFTCCVVHLCTFTCCLPGWSDDYGDNRMVQTRSLSKISSSVARQQYVDTSDEDDYPRYPHMSQQMPHRRKNSRASSQENLGQAPPVRQEAFHGCSSWPMSPDGGVSVLLLADERAKQTHVCHWESAESPGGENHPCRRGEERRDASSAVQLVLFELMFLLSPCRPPVWVRMRKRSWGGSWVSWPGIWVTRVCRRTRNPEGGVSLWAEVQPAPKLDRQSLWNLWKTKNWAHPVMRCPLRPRR